MKRILIIDDEEAIRRIFRLAIEAAGFEVEAVKSASSALNYLATTNADLVVTDILLPDMDGVELVQAVRARLPNVPIVAMSGGGSAGIEARLEFAQTLGGVTILRNAVVSLSCDPRGLNGSIGGFLDSRQTTKERISLD